MQRDLNGYSQPSRTTLFSLGIYILVHGLQKLYYSRNQKRFNNGLNGFFFVGGGNKTEQFLHVFKKSVIILVNE